MGKVDQTKDPKYWVKPWYAHCRTAEHAASTLAYDAATMKHGFPKHGNIPSLDDRRNPRPTPELWKNYFSLFKKNDFFDQRTRTIGFPDTPLDGRKETTEVTNQD